MSGWIGVDLDGTLAYYDGWRGELHIGPPVPAMLDRVRRWLAEGKTVRIVTARVAPMGVLLNKDGQNRDIDAVRRAIGEWCLHYIGEVLVVTHEKDFGMIELWDDRCVQVIPNTGARADGKP